MTTQTIRRILAAVLLLAGSAGAQQMSQLSRVPVGQPSARIAKFRVDPLSHHLLAYVVPADAPQGQGAWMTAAGMDGLATVAIKVAADGTLATGADPGGAIQGCNACVVIGGMNGLSPVALKVGADGTVATSGVGGLPQLQTNGVNNAALGLNIINSAGVAGLTCSNPATNQEQCFIANIIAGGTQVMTGTVTNGVAGDVWTLNGSGVWVNGTLGIQFTDKSTVNTASYTYLTGDRGHIITRKAAGAMTDTLPQAGSAGFLSNWYVKVYNTDTVNSDTVTTTTSTINGVAGATGIVVKPNSWCDFESDNTNYMATCGPGQIVAGTNITLTENSDGSQTVAATGGSGIQVLTGVGALSAGSLTGTNFYPFSIQAGVASAKAGSTLIPATGTMKNLRISLADAVPASLSYAFTIFYCSGGGACTMGASVITCTAAAASFGCNDLTHTVAVTIGDTVALQEIATGAGTVIGTTVSAHLEFQ